MTSLKIVLLHFLSIYYILTGFLFPRDKVNCQCHRIYKLKYGGRNDFEIKKLQFICVIMNKYYQSFFFK